MRPSGPRLSGVINNTLSSIIPLDSRSPCHAYFVGLGLPRGSAFTMMRVRVGPSVLSLRNAADDHVSCGCDRSSPSLHVFGIHVGPALKALCPGFAFADTVAAGNLVTPAGFTSA